MADPLGGRKHLFGLIEKVEDQPDGTIRVFGIASSEDLDDQNEIVRGSAIRNAIPGYMRFPALREMHDLKAAGTALELDVGDDNVTRIVAHVVDPIAVSKVRNLVYRGFSIGGRVTQREPGNPKCITGLVLNEISLVDRPANPSSIIDTWKIADIGDDGMADAIGTIADTPAGAVLKALVEPVQIWACGAADHQHTAKAEAAACIQKRAKDGAAAAQDELRKAEEELSAPVVVEPAPSVVPPQVSVEVLDRQSVDRVDQAAESAAKASDDKPKGDYGSVTYADPGHQADKKPRYPINTPEHIRAAWNYINKPKNARKYSSVALASIKAKIVAAWKDKIDKDGPPSAQSSKKAARSFINSLVAEETGKIVADTEVDQGKVIELMSKMNKGQEAGHQMGLDIAAMASKRAMGVAESKSDRKAASNFCKTVLDAGACDLGAGGREMLTDGNPTQGAGEATNHATQDTGHNAQTSPPNPTGKVPSSPVPASTSMKAVAASAYIDGQLNELGKAAATAAMSPYQHLMMIAHNEIKRLSDGATCKASSAKPDYLRRAQMEDLHAAHYFFGRGRGLKCDMAEGAAKLASASDPVTDSGDAEDETIDKAADAEDLTKVGLPQALVKALQDIKDAQSARDADMVKAVTGLAEQLGATRQRVEDIAKQEMPPLTIAKGTIVTEKGGPDASGPSAEDIAAAISKMSPEQIQLATLKGTFLNGPDDNLTRRFGGQIIR